MYSWYKHCKEGHQKLQQALRQDDSHAAEQYRKEFRRQKRKWKRVYDKKAQEKMLDDLKHNPRKFWTAFQGKRACMLQADIAELQRYWSGLYNVPDHGALGEGGEDLAGLLHRMNSIAFTSAGQATATVLNNDLDEHEVIMGLKKLHSGRAPGPDGLRAEFLKQAFVMETVDDGPPVKRHVLLPVLFDLYQALFSSGEFVRKWSMATLSPIFKKGDAANLDNYRAIAVGSVLGKLYAVILDTRLSVCAEKNGWRAEGQAGFRAGKSTVDHVFVLRHLIESTQKSRKVLYCCFVDFRKAFDRVRRDYLIQRLAELGVHGRMLQAIIQMYWSVPLVPKLHGTVGDAIPSTCGVKQGDPLSPLLFGLFIDEFESWLRQRLPNVGVQMGRKLVQMLLYADYREANNAARRAVKKDQERYFKQQALFAEHALKAGNLAVFHKHVQRIFKEQQGSSSAAPTAVLGGADGKQLFQSREEVVKCFAEHFADVLNCPAKLDQQMQQTIEELVQKMEAGQGANQQSEAAAQPPTVQEVEEAVFACRNGAAPGVDGIAAPMLKLSGTMLKWLHRVIVAVWESGKAPVEWKRALLVALYKGKGERKVRDSYRGISLLSIPGKVYVLVILAKISSHIDAQLLDNQSAFRKGRGLTDALFTIRQVISKSVAFDQPLFMAFVDLRKAYDSVPRDTLWRILHVYGVHTKLIELLMDLHTGTQAAVRMGGVVSEWFDVHGGVRQGCVIAPLLFNIYMDFVVRQAMAQMPEGCGVKLAYHADGKLERDGCGSGGCVELLSVLLYADDMVLLSPSREELVVMLQVMDKVAASLGLRINASKTEILSIDKDWKEGDVPVQQGPEVVISEGVVKEVSQFKYLGSVLVTDGRLDVELNIRRGKAVGRFKQFEKMWGTKHLSLATKVKCYKAYVLPILLFGSECWSLTKVQSQKLERVHSSCLRSILGVRLSDRHTNEHIRKSCGVATLSAYITANRLRWLGHVGRMEEGRLPHIALFSSLHGDMTRPVGRPRHTWEKCVCADLKVLGQDEGSWEASCQIKSAWRKRLWDLTHPWESQRLVRCRRRTKQAIDKHVERYVLPFSGWEDGGSPVPRWWEPPPAPTRVVLDPAASPPPMCDGSGAGFGF